MLEYHCFIDQQKTYEQAYIFIVDRNETRIRMRDVFSLMVQHKPGEVKTKINLAEAQNLISNNPGGNIKIEDAHHIFTMFGDLIPEDIQKQYQEELEQYHLDELESEMFLTASDVALIAHPTTITDFDELIKTYGKKL